MKATEARKATQAWHDKATRDNLEYNRKRVAREKATASAVWEKRSPALIKQIDGYIKRASANGDNGTYEPSDLNPNGDEIIWLKGPDQPIFDLLMEYYRGEGYDVKEYQNYGMKITW